MNIQLVKRPHFPDPTSVDDATLKPVRINEFMTSQLEWLVLSLLQVEISFRSSNTRRKYDTK